MHEKKTWWIQVYTCTWQNGYMLYAKYSDGKARRWRQENVTTGQTNRRRDKQTPEENVPMSHRQSNKVVLGNCCCIICLHSYVINTHTIHYSNGVASLTDTVASPARWTVASPWRSLGWSDHTLSLLNI